MQRLVTKEDIENNPWLSKKGVSVNQYYDFDAEVTQNPPSPNSDDTYDSDITPDFIQSANTSQIVDTGDIVEEETIPVPKKKISGKYTIKNRIEELTTKAIEQTKKAALKKAAKSKGKK